MLKPPLPPSPPPPPSPPDPAFRDIEGRWYQYFVKRSGGRTYLGAFQVSRTNRGWRMTADRLAPGMAMPTTISNVQYANGEWTFEMWWASDHVSVILKKNGETFEGKTLRGKTEIESHIWSRVPLH